MGRGHGAMQRAILAVFEQHPDEILDAVEIAARAVGTNRVINAGAPLYRRALSDLVREGMLEDMGRQGWRNGRRRYATPLKAQQYRERIDQLLGSGDGQRIACDCTR
jgi:hypothetical protein